MIKTHTVTKVVEDVTYETTDGEFFKLIDEAILHQEVLDGKKKICPTCNGEGYEYYQKEHFGGFENGGYPTSVTTEKRTCSTCTGRKYLELKFA